MTTLFVCYGNDLIGNDGFGRAVYEALPDDVNKIFTVQLLPELLEEIKGYERLIFVDAAHGAGDVELYEIEPSNDDTADFHHLTPQTLLALLDALYTKTPKSYICVGYFESFEVGEIDVDFDLKVSSAVSKISVFRADT